MGRVTGYRENTDGTLRKVTYSSTDIKADRVAKRWESDNETYRVSHERNNMDFMGADEFYADRERREREYPIICAELDRVDREREEKKKESGKKRRGWF